MVIEDRVGGCFDFVQRMRNEGGFARLCRPEGVCGGLVLGGVEVVMLGFGLRLSGSLAANRVESWLRHKCCCRRVG